MCEQRRPKCSRSLCPLSAPSVISLSRLVSDGAIDQVEAIPLVVLLLGVGGLLGCMVPYLRRGICDSTLAVASAQLPARPQRCKQVNGVQGRVDR